MRTFKKLLHDFHIAIYNSKSEVTVLNLKLIHTNEARDRVVKDHSSSLYRAFCILPEDINKGINSKAWKPFLNHMTDWAEKYKIELSAQPFYRDSGLALEWSKRKTAIAGEGHLTWRR